MNLEIYFEYIRFIYNIIECDKISPETFENSKDYYIRKMENKNLDEIYIFLEEFYKRHKKHLSEKLKINYKQFNRIRKLNILN